MIRKKLMEEITEVKTMCRSNMGGYWELNFLPYSGGFYDQPADDMERIMEVLNVVNSEIKRKKDKEDNSS